MTTTVLVQASWLSTVVFVAFFAKIFVLVAAEAALNLEAFVPDALPDFLDPLVLQLLLVVDTHIILGCLPVAVLGFDASDRIGVGALAEVRFFLRTEDLAAGGVDNDR